MIEDVAGLFGDGIEGALAVVKFFLICFGLGVLLADGFGHFSDFC